jgi:hypothetical protein
MWCSGKAMHEDYRLFFSKDERHGLIVIRPIGALPPDLFIDRLFENLACIEKPWAYRRVHDYRRYLEKIDDRAEQVFARRWRDLTKGVTYEGQIAIVTYEAGVELCRPRPSPLFSHETVCCFTDYHEAIGWLMADDPAKYMSNVQNAARTHRPEVVLVQ